VRAKVVRAKGTKAYAVGRGRVATAPGDLNSAKMGPAGYHVEASSPHVGFRLTSSSFLHELTGSPGPALPEKPQGRPTRRLMMFMECSDGNE
jgi:hypothetical protein